MAQIININDFSPPEEGLATAIGYFDGVHRGHQKLIRTMQQEKGRLPACIFTFRNHPKSIVEPGNAPLLLTLFEEKVSLLAEMGIDYIVWMDFTKELSSYTPADFLDKIIVNKLLGKHIFVGENFHFGKNASGSALFLQKHLHSIGLQGRICTPELIGGERISSSKIRKELKKGEVAKAANLLGRNFFIVSERAHSYIYSQYENAWHKPTFKIIPPNGRYKVLMNNHEKIIELYTKKEFFITGRVPKDDYKKIKVEFVEKYNE